MQIGLLMLAGPGTAREVAERTEAAGFAHLAFGDTQNIGPEAWGQLLLAASASSTIRLGTGVTNPVTRDAAVTASAALALQIESEGRAFCGIGRGDSALAKIGRRPERVDEFERYVTQLGGYLAGESVDRGTTKSRIEFSIPSHLPRVPVEIAATGPRVIELAARCADAIIFCLGADPAVLGPAIRSARDAARRAGRDPDSLRYGAFVNCVLDDDLGKARSIARGGVSVFARFAGWSHRTAAPRSEALAAAAKVLGNTYEMDHHAQAENSGAQSLDDDFLDQFAVLGPAAHVTDRFQALAEIGLDFVTIAPGSSDMTWEEGWHSIERIGREVIPQLRSGSPAR
jgi:5,10-methylenetetrahydromethanopterin reductase